MPITLNGDTGITTPTYGGADAAEYLVPVTAFKNRIINGAMQIDQRNAGASVTVNNNFQFYTIDRWQGIGQATDGVFTLQQSTVAPAGFQNSLLATVTTADTSLGATQGYIISQPVEGFNSADFAWGTANAQTVTLSFWVRSSLTGTFGGSLRNGDGTRSYPFSYNISAANTWEYKTVTAAGDTTGTWGTGNGRGVMVFFSLGNGTDRLGTAGAWNANNNQGATGQVNPIATSGATWAITGVQLEKGSNATSFDYRSIGTELALCQRYYQVLKGLTAVANTTTSVLGCFSIFTPMRASPTLGKTSGNFQIGDMVSVASNTSSTPTLEYSNNDISIAYALGGFSGLTQFRSYRCEPVPAYPTLFTVSAEL
jgi:hypothetical protein